MTTARLDKYARSTGLTRESIFLRALDEYLEKRVGVVFGTYYAIIHDDGYVDLETVSTDPLATLKRGDGATIGLFHRPPLPGNISKPVVVASPKWFDAVALLSCLDVTMRFHGSTEHLIRSIAEPYLPHLPGPISADALDDIAFEWKGGWGGPNVCEKACHLWLAWKNVADYHGRAGAHFQVQYAQDTYRHALAACSAKRLSIDLDLAPTAEQVAQASNHSTMRVSPEVVPVV